MPKSWIAAEASFVDAGLVLAWNLESEVSPFFFFLGFHLSDTQQAGEGRNGNWIPF